MGEETGKDWPLFYKEQLILGNPDSNVGICTLWSVKENFSWLPKEKYGIIGNLYSSYGINPMLKNILANPKIRHLIVCGADLNKTKEILVNFAEKGIDDGYKVVGSEAYIDKTIPEEAIGKLRKNLKVIVLRNANGEEAKKELATVLEGISSEGKAFMEPIIIREESSTEAMYSEEEAPRTEGKTISEAWLKALDITLKFGEEKKSEYGLKQKEILDMATIVKAEEENFPEWFPFSKKELEDYQSKFFTEEKPEGVSYTYGERLLKPGQIKAAVERLKKSPHTRRAIAVTWKLEEDAASSNPPCLIEVAWSVKHGKLCQTSTFRSQDMFGAWPLNIFALRQLQKQVAGELGIPAGSLVNISVSAHIYESNWKAAEELVGKHHRGRMMRLDEDPRGFFVIKVEKGEIIAEHRLKDGRKTRYEFRGNRAEEIYRRILNENLISMLDHAAYLGKELARAEIALKEGRNYVQEKA
ncbi:DUF4346 domain-containing protein [Candidatus Woesearchaeota archaeon]|nr:DUF4346 domain-containing protein [Candidatus Woesearchaeota archaeon]